MRENEHLSRQSHNDDEIGGLTVTLEEILRGRIKEDGSTAEIDAYVDGAGNIHMIVVGSPDELWPEFIVTGNTVAPVEEDKSNGTNVRN